MTTESNPNPDAPADPAKVEELRARLEKLDREIKSTLERARPPPPPPAVRFGVIALIIGVPIGCAVLGGMYFGWLGGIGGLLAPFVLLVLGVVVKYYGGQALRGQSVDVDALTVGVDPDAREVRIAAPKDAALLPQAILALVDCTALRWQTRSDGITSKVRELATQRLETGKCDAPDWAVSDGDREPTPIALGPVTLTRNRLGMSYSFTSSIGGRKLGPDDELSVLLAVVAYGVNRPQGDTLANALIALCQAGPGRGGGAFKKAVARLEQ